MNRFHLSLLVVLLLLFTPRFYAARSSFPSPSTARQQAFRPKTNAPFASQAGEFESEKRKALYSYCEKVHIYAKPNGASFHWIGCILR
ncbi:hypothetical protein CMV_009058 [Castanea mollissima]|uniref:Secreted protein n=1 Tax=Castanea mollissima TaxID=60419 RepID=A0A8J4RF16_9ROSI|nr:hypothetical protein CMV_009058 [Castanea mollissima]